MSSDSGGGRASAVLGGAVCPGCGASIEDPGGVTHPTPGASRGCWAAYGDLVAREYGEWANPPIHRLTVATYGAQHAGGRSAKAVQAMALHLITLYFTLDRGVEAARVPRVIGRAVADPSEFRWLEPPPSPDWHTVLDVRGARDLKEHTSRVQRWGRSVWEAWSSHHDTVRKWAGL